MFDEIAGIVIALIVVFVGNVIRNSVKKDKFQLVEDNVEPLWQFKILNLIDREAQKGLLLFISVFMIGGGIFIAIIIMVQILRAFIG